VLGRGLLKRVPFEIFRKVTNLEILTFCEQVVNGSLITRTFVSGCYVKLNITATTLVFPHRPIALDYGIKHINLRMFSTSPNKECGYFDG